MHHWIYQQGDSGLSQGIESRMKEYDPRTVAAAAPSQSAM